MEMEEDTAQLTGMTMSSDDTATATVAIAIAIATETRSVPGTGP